MRLSLFLAVLALSVLTPHHAFSDEDAAPVSAPSGAVTVVDPTPAQAALPSAPVVSKIAVAEVAAPPAWAENLMVDAEALPFVGPFISKALMYIGVLGSILTVLAASLLSIASVLAGIFNYAGIPKAVAAITAFQDSKFMYYLKYFSMFNAKKPE